MTERHASCRCGRLRLTARGEPVRISMCHCLACQRRTGSVFGTQARFPDDQVSIEGEGKTYERIGDSGKAIRYVFCPECGSTVYYRLEAAPGVVAVPVGAFADPGFPMPWVSIYEGRRHGWVRVPEGVERED